MTYYETADLGLTAAFITLGHPCIGNHVENGKTLFQFENSNNLIELAANYFGGGLEVNARSYYYNLRDLKKAIYSAYENTK